MVRRTRSADFMGGDWVFPGGAVDAVDGDDPPVRGVDPEMTRYAAAALRELAEEAGVWLTDPPVDAETAEAWDPLRGAPLYEAVRATGRSFAGERLAWFGHWVTPAGLPIRFDARFFACEVESGTRAVADEREVHDATWVSPTDALAAGRRGEWAIPFPTARTLETLARFSSTAGVMGYARNLERVERIEPRLLADEEGGVTIVLPGDPRYEAVGDR